MFGGPVLYIELLLGSRRTRLYLFRLIYAGWLLLQFGLWYLIYLIGSYSDPQGTARFGTDYIELFVYQQLILLTLATPVLAAGAITEEKERGTLQYLLTAELSATEIVVGKLIGRSLGVLSIFVAGIPFLCLMANFTGMGLLGVVVVLVQTVLATLALAAVSMLASVWARHTRDAVLGLYAVGGMVWGVGALMVLLTTPTPTTPGTRGSLLFQVFGAAGDGFRALDPVQVLEPALKGADAGGLLYRLGWHIVAWGGVGLLCLVLAIVRLRPAYVRQLEGAGKRKRQLLWSARPGIGNQPITWKERFVVGLAPLPWFRFIPRWLGITLVAILSTLTGLLVLSATAGLGPEQLVMLALRGDFGRIVINPVSAGRAFMWAGVAVTLLASLVVGIRCSGSITGEREKHTWEALLLTPLATPQLVRAKLWGVIGSTYPYLLAYAVPMFLCMFLADPTLVIHLAIQLGVIWLAMFYVGAAGLWCSAGAKSSWRSLLGTVAWGYLGGAAIQAVLSPVLIFVWLFARLVVYVIEQSSGVALPNVNLGAFFLGTAVFLGLGFLLGSWFFLKEAEKRVADYDRARHWHDEPRSHRRRVIREALPVD